MKLTGTHIRSLIGKKEDERVEFKRAASELPDNIWETYSAFCNTDGGTIILGIREGKNKTYSIEGVSDAHKLIDDFLLQGLHGLGVGAEGAAHGKADRLVDHVASSFPGCSSSWSI